MRKVVFRKMYMSILATMFVLITSIATTFAWVGMLSTATFGGFEMNLKTIDFDSPYFLTISSIDSTNRSDFGSSVARIDIQKQIMDNNPYINYSSIDENDAVAVNSFFNRSAKLTPVTTSVEGNQLGQFYEMPFLKDKKTDLAKSYGFYKFDLYITVDAVAGIQDTTEINANVFLENIADCIKGTLSTSSLVNGNPFTGSSFVPSTTYDPLNILPNFNSSLTINSESAARIAFEIYDPIALTDTYQSTDTPSELRIYQGGTKTPSVSNNVYSFGGILPEEYNLAIQELNKIYNLNLKLTNAKLESDSSYYLGAYNRFLNDTDRELIDTLENKRLWTKPNTLSGTNYLGVHKDTTTNESVQTKMKITVYFWFEGFDADCFQFIDNKNVTIDLAFSTDKETN